MKMFVLILGAAALLAAAYYGIQGKRSDAGGGLEPSGPKQTLDNVRQKARGIEEDSQRRADELMRKSQ